MDDMVLYLELQKLPKEVLLIIGSEHGIKIMQDILIGVCLEKLTVLSLSEHLFKAVEKEKENIENDSQYYIPRQFILLRKNEFDDHKFGQEDLAILYEGVKNQEFVEKLSKLSAKYLIGMHDRNYINTFDIWEKFRENTKKIYIISYVGGGKKDVLNWEKNEENSIELSIIFPMYNIAKYLPQCIETVTKWQTDFVEFLFVDDGSPDNCADIVKKYAQRDSRIKLLSKKNGGCASARQYGLERAKGRYIGFVDPDDFIQPDMYRKLLAKALEGTYEIAYCGYQEYYENTGLSAEVPDALSYPYNEGTSDPAKIDELIGYQRVAIWRGKYSKDLIQRNKIHFYTDLKRFDDLPFKVETFAFAKSVVMLPENLYYYRLEREGQDVAANDQRLYVHFDIFAYLDQSIGRTGNQQLIDYYQMCKLQTHRYALEKIQDKYKKEYLDRARKDLSALMNEQRTYTMTCILLGNEVAEDFRTIMQE